MVGNLPAQMLDDAILGEITLGGGLVAGSALYIFGKATSGIISETSLNKKK